MHQTKGFPSNAWEDQTSSRPNALLVVLQIKPTLSFSKSYNGWENCVET